MHTLCTKFAQKFFSVRFERYAVTVGGTGKVIPFLHELFGCFVQTETVDGIACGIGKTEMCDRLCIVGEDGQTAAGQEYFIHFAPHPKGVEQGTVQIEDKAGQVIECPHGIPP